MPSNSSNHSSVELNPVNQKTPSNISIQQSQILIDAINCYLQWRNNKNEDDGRGYHVTWFTKLRHYTKTGELRAIALKNTLIDQPEATLAVIKNHFRGNTQYNNHSLNTYLLEHIVTSYVLFLIPNHLLETKTKAQRMALCHFLLAQETLTEEEFSYQVSRNYPSDNKEVLGIKCAYLKTALDAHHPDAEADLKSLANQGCAESQYILASFYQRQTQQNKAIAFYMMATELNHSVAKQDFMNTPFPVEVCLIIAQSYNKGEGVLKNINLALHFYSKAYSLGCQEAALWLGNYYSPLLSLDSKQVDLSDQKRAIKSAQYYLLPAQKGDQNAVTLIQKLANSYPHVELAFIAGQALVERVQDIQEGLTCLKYAVAANHSGAKRFLNTLFTKNPEAAMECARLYEEDDTTVASQYYGWALHHQVHAALTPLDKLAQKKNAEALYQLATYFYTAPQSRLQGLKLMLRSSSLGHDAAQAFLVQKINTIEEAHFISQWYLKRANKSTPVENRLKAFDFYAKAARWGDTNSLSELDHLVLDLKNPPELLFRIAMLYFEVCADKEPGLERLLVLAENNFSLATKKLDELTTNNSVHSYLLATLYLNNSNGNNDLLKAAMYYALAVQANSSTKLAQKAQAELSILVKLENFEAHYALQLSLYYYQGYGALKQNFKLAKQSFELAALKGSLEGYYFLGEMHRLGQGVVINYFTAAQYYLMADASSPLVTDALNKLIQSTVLHARELTALALMCYHGSDSLPVNKLIASQLFTQAIKRNDSAAACHLADMYLSGEGVPKDKLLAFDTLLQAASWGSKDALITLERLADDMNPERKRALSSLYQGFFNTSKAQYWKQQATVSATLTLIP